MSWPYAHHDASYVIGALFPAERRGFEQHLTDSDSCARAVTEVAGLPRAAGPGRRHRAGSPSSRGRPPRHAAADTPAPGTPPPAATHPGHRRTRRGRVRRDRVATLTGLAGGQHAPVTGPTPGVTSSTTPASAGMPMGSVGSVPMRATVAFHSVPWGTRLDMTCTYNAPASTYGTTPRPATYLLVVHTRDGHTQQVATWRSLPGRTMRLSAATAASRAQIASVEVRATDGRPVLRLRT